MDTRVAKGQALPLGIAEGMARQYEHLFSQAMEEFQAGDSEASIEVLREVARLAHQRGDSAAHSLSSALLGSVLLQMGDFESALPWLERARAQASPPDNQPWHYALRALIIVTRARGTAQRAKESISETQAELEEEIIALEAEAVAKAGHLLQNLLTAPSPGAPPGSADETKAVGDPKEDSKLHISVQLFGRFEAKLRDQTPIALCSNRKGQALFKILSTDPRSRVHKETLLDLLWRDEDPAVATGKLHIAASRMRKALIHAGLGQDVLLFEYDGYCLNRELAVESDVVRFEAHFRAGRRLDMLHEADLALAEYEAGLALYRGAYLADEVGVDWPLAERTRLEDQYLTMLTRLVAGYFDRQAYAKCAECCRRILQIDSLREDIYRQQMRCLSRVGQRSQALRQYQICANTLRQELCLELSRETQLLAQQIRDEQPV